MLTKNNVKPYKYALKVTSAGFEPATNGAEIRHSIQLNYEAILSWKYEVRSWEFLLRTSYFKLKVF